MIVKAVFVVIMLLFNKIIKRGIKILGIIKIGNLPLKLARICWYNQE